MSKKNCPRGLWMTPYETFFISYFSRNCRQTRGYELYKHVSSRFNIFEDTVALLSIRIMFKFEQKQNIPNLYRKTIYIAVSML